MYATRATAAARPLALGDDATVTVTRKTIPGGDQGAYATVAEMARLIVQGSSAPLVRRQGVELASGAGERDYAAQLRAIRAYLTTHVRFLRDPDGTELLHEPELMVRSVLENGVIHVDCDDVAMLAGALGKSIGLRCRIVTVAFRDPDAARTGVDSPTPFAHTWAELASPVDDSPRWMEMDTTRTTQRLDPSLISRSFTVDV